MDRGMDRTMDRGMDRGMDRTMDRGMDRGMDRTMDRGMDRGMDRTMDRGMDRGMDRTMDRGMDRTGGGAHLRSRSANRGFPSTGPGPSTRSQGYHSLDRDRDGYGGDRDSFMPIDRARDRSLDRTMDYAGGGSNPYGAGPVSNTGTYSRRDRSLDRGRDTMLDPDDGLYTGRDLGPPHRSRISPNPASLQRDSYIGDLQTTNSDLQRDLSNLKKELELTNQKLGSSMHSIKTFWSPELKKERALRKEESAKYALMNDQLKLLNSENQVTIDLTFVPILFSL